MKITKEGIDLIKGFEGRRLEAYQCSAGVWTIGYGHTDGVRKGDIITPKQADDFLLEDVAWVEASINRLVKVPLSQFQFNALCSFVFNIGHAAFAKSTLLKLLNKGDYDAVPAQMARWNKVSGKVVKGLVNRRQAEADLWNVDWKHDLSMPQAIDVPDKPLVKSRTMANASVAGMVGTALAVTPAIEPAGEVVKIAQENTQGFLLVVGLAIVAFAVVAAFLRYQDRAKA